MRRTWEQQKVYRVHCQHIGCDFKMDVYDDIHAVDEAAAHVNALDTDPRGHLTLPNGDHEVDIYPVTVVTRA